MTSKVSPVSITFVHLNGGASELVDPHFFLKLVRPNDEEEVECVLANISDENIRFEKMSFICKSSYVAVHLMDDTGVTHGTASNLPPKGEYRVKVRMHFHNQQDCASMQVRLRFDFNRYVDGKHQFMTRYIVCCVVPSQHQETFDMLRTFSSSHGGDFGHDSEDEDEDHDLIIIWLDREFMETLLELVVDLDGYRIPKSLELLVNNGWHQYPPDFIINEEDLRLRGWENYCEFFHKLLYLEELQVQIDLKAYTMKRAGMRRGGMHGGWKEFIVKIPGLLEKRPSVLRGDRIFAKPLVDNPQYKYEGEVLYIAQENAVFRFPTRFEDDIREILPTTKFKIEFRQRRTHMKVMHRAIDMLTKSDRFEECLFPKCNSGNRRTTREEINLEFFNDKVRQNAQQKCAVEHIVRGTSGNAPYIIYGPPGTGKTFTLVEAIKQVYKLSKRRSDIRILVCAPTNHAADLVTRGILEAVPKSDVLRTIAISRATNEVDEEIMDVSQHVHQVTANLVKSMKIVISTLSTCGWLVSGGLTHFTHLFIDEAGFAIEPETLIPMAMLDSSQQCQVVLVGDPKQLGPVIHSAIAKKAQLGMSMLERLMKEKDGPYLPNSNNRYNPNFVTKLVQSFRSHPDILEVPNELFYNNELIACADEKAREMFCEWSKLPKKALQSRCPMIFHGIEGREEQQKDSPSWFNNFEANCVIDYVKKLLSARNKPSVTPYQIGVVAPYHKQRFNVAVTRAKALLIIVGSPIALIHDKNWKKLIKFIIDKGGYRGQPPEQEVLRRMSGLDPPNSPDEEEAAANAAAPQQTSRGPRASIMMRYVDDEINRPE
ncbi:putative helicase mov-10-B.1 isoform X2 [Watersipora subatra]|uniref:putative helicase mov-10-B.1 isoform X2 n=1 Tax=Watersipora subatra TaxID=2589382 RepID=UPI00355B2DCB